MNKISTIYIFFGFEILCIEKLLGIVNLKESELLKNPDKIYATDRLIGLPIFLTDSKIAFFLISSCACDSTGKASLHSVLLLMVCWKTAYGMQ